MAAQEGNVAATQILLDKGASSEVVNAYEDKPHHIAAENGHDKTVSLLLDKGADLECVGKTDRQS